MAIFQEIPVSLGDLVSFSEKWRHYTHLATLPGANSLQGPQFKFQGINVVPCPSSRWRQGSRSAQRLRLPGPKSCQVLPISFKPKRWLPSAHVWDTGGLEAGPGIVLMVVIGPCPSRLGSACLRVYIFSIFSFFFISLS